MDVGSIEDDSDNPIISLQPDSMYITTQMLMAPGKCHWALLVTDAQGSAVRHHWAGAHGGLGIGATETYISQVERSEDIRTYTKGNAVVFGYFQIAGYVPQRRRIQQPSGGDEADEAVLVQTCRSAFGEEAAKYKNLRDARRNGLTCRIWLEKVLKRLADPTVGVLVRDGMVVSVEEIIPWIYEKTKECEEVIVQGGTYTSPVFVV
ncbi:hypothetical protein FRB94_000319 [Tulasnella sp. JGI-2019a]|nr:hypothetical protein FRB93_010222 [Tulasnella sp. JGI-2019a]KAG8988936.1 hypothetical protein FRB94_000319 [Tulasnella sp. JGI-2019a]KAG9023295.1 hypothetical protein FRB95_013275 [Tulasnella sp. JGI-2019a]